MTLFLSLAPAFEPIATLRARSNSASDAALSFWASALRTALVSETAAWTQHVGALARAARSAAGSTASEELERWDVLTAVGDSFDGPPTAVQLALLDHLASPDLRPISH